MQGELSRLEYRQGEFYYVDGRSAVDGWLEVLLAELEMGGDVEPSFGQMQLLKQAALKARTFMEYVAGLDKDQPRGEWADFIQSTIAAVVDGGIKLWCEVRPTGKDQREALVRRLEALRWSSFDKIPAK